jgi:hypothetical protein
MRVVLGALLLAALVAGCGNTSKKYGRSDVEQAFRSQGFDLTAAPNLPGGFQTPSSFGGVVLVPRTHEPFAILVYEHESDANKASQVLRGQASSDTFDVQQGNVVVFSDEGVPAPMRIRINAALFQLP